MANTELPDNDDVMAMPVTSSVLESIDAGPDDSEAQAELGAERIARETALLKRVIDGIKGCQAVVANPDGLPKQAEGSDVSGSEEDWSSDWLVCPSGRL